MYGNCCLFFVLCIVVQIMHFLYYGCISECSFIVDKMPEQGKHNIVAVWHCPLSHKTQVCEYEANFLLHFLFLSANEAIATLLRGVAGR